MPTLFADAEGRILLDADGITLQYGEVCCCITISCTDTDITLVPDTLTSSFPNGACCVPISTVTSITFEGYGTHGGAFFPGWVWFNTGDTLSPPGANTHFAILFCLDGKWNFLSYMGVPWGAPSGYGLAYCYAELDASLVEVTPTTIHFDLSGSNALRVFNPDNTPRNTTGCDCFRAYSV